MSGKVGDYKPLRVPFQRLSPGFGSSYPWGSKIRCHGCGQRFWTRFHKSKHRCPADRRREVLRLVRAARKGVEHGK